ncbi:hypothetical protein [Streptomyces sp. MST-110588]|uniref:hypothetical protein n=1 Tax=Streptomyces sp. MST-110588 TaxID=2833628 RepID=UPI001F5C7D09|nr:hypothetical protein [Streptomyces sp. MST-110588]UNO41505.1 hypothetical protein KGS77_20465 [Streptomyces sp. MST-110588]
MLPSASTLQQIGLVILLVATVAWFVSLVRALRRDAFQLAVWHGSRALLRSVPRQTTGPAGPAGPPPERVELSAAEREAFATLVRQLTGRR